MGFFFTFSQHSLRLLYVFHACHPRPDPRHRFLHSFHHGLFGSTVRRDCLQKLLNCSSRLECKIVPGAKIVLYFKYISFKRNGLGGQKWERMPMPSMIKFHSKLQGSNPIRALWSSKSKSNLLNRVIIRNVFITDVSFAAGSHKFSNLWDWGMKDLCSLPWP